ncbi:MAG: hypothetical protein MJ245_01620 [Clostridia bacterium]|nr:hypothetical protein [Clostridia bacterium]
MAMNEKMMILKMLEEGKITTEESIKLIKACDQSSSVDDIVDKCKKFFELSKEKIEPYYNEVLDKAKETYKKAEPTLKEYYAKAEPTINKAKAKAKEAYKKAEPKVKEAYKKAEPKVKEAIDKVSKKAGVKKEAQAPIKTTAKKSVAKTTTKKK